MKSTFTKLLGAIICLLPMGLTAQILQTVTYTGATTTYTVPAGVTSLTIEAKGAQGGGSVIPGGLGAEMIGNFTVTPGEVLTVLVGQEGNVTSATQSSGGGASAVWNAMGNPLIVAGGGGGAATLLGTYIPVGIDASITEDGNNGYSELNGLGGSEFRHGVGGTAGNGSTIAGPDGAAHAGNGAGFYTAGAAGDCGGGGIALVNGGAGGSACSSLNGAFGGAGSNGNSGGGGGGGYSGGGGSYHNPTNGGGGGSFNGGSNQMNSIGNTGNGEVVFSISCDPLTTTVSTMSLCSAELLTLSAASNIGGNVTWDNGVVNNVAFQPDSVGVIVYTAVSDSASECPYSVSITVAESPAFDLSTSDELINGDGSVYLTLNSGVFPFQYDWDNDGTGDFDDMQNLSNVPAGTYTVVVEDGSGCTRTESAVVYSSVSITELEKGEVRLYPNPATNILTIEVQEATDYKIIDASGRVCASGQLLVNNSTINVEHLNNGSYTIQVISEQGVMTAKFVKF